MYMSSLISLNPIEILRQECHLMDNYYQIKIFIKLLENLKNKQFYEVGTEEGFYSLIAGTNGWKVTSFEMNPNHYQILCHKIQQHHLENMIIPIYTKIKLRPSLDHFISKQNVGLIKINVEGHEIEVINGLKYSLEQQLIDGIIINIYPKLRPTNDWIGLILYLQKLGYNIYDLKAHEINDFNMLLNQIQLVSFNINFIHQTEETTLLFLKNNINNIMD